MASSKEECDQNLALILQICEALGVPLAVKKLEGPTIVIIFLGIESTAASKIMLCKHKK